MSLYKYLSDSCLEPLENGYFRFTQPIEFNDPFETRPHILSVFGNIDINELIKNISDEEIDDLMKDGFKGIFNKLPKKIKRNIFKIIIKYAPEILIEEIKKVDIDKLTPITQNILPDIISKKIGMLCLSKNPNSLIMWSHYANNNKGILIEFDENHPFFSKDDIKTGNPDFDPYYGNPIPIMYRKNRPAFNYFDKTPPELFLTKSIEWAYEEEYRIIMPLYMADKKINENIFLFKIPFDTILSVRFGVKIEKSLRNYVIEKIKSINSNIKIFDAYLSEEFYEIEFVEKL